MNIIEFAKLTLDHESIGLNANDYNITFISHGPP